MNILLDTNIIIPLEDTSRALDSSFAELRKLSAEQSHCLYIHPMQLEDINRDKNQERRYTKTIIYQIAGQLCTAATGVVLHPIVCGNQLLCTASVMMLWSAAPVKKNDVKASNK